MGRTIFFHSSDKAHASVLIREPTGSVVDMEENRLWLGFAATVEAAGWELMEENIDEKGWNPDLKVGFGDLAYQCFPFRVGKGVWR